MSTRALELRVGVITLVTGIVIACATLWLGRDEGPVDVNLFVDFPAASGLKVGSKVCIAGVPAGAVVGMAAFDGRHVEAVGRRVYVRAEIALEAESASMVRENADFTITTEGMLGERYVEITPGEGDAPSVAPGAIVLGSPSFRAEDVSENGGTVSRIVAHLVRKHRPHLINVGSDTRSIIDTAMSAIDRADAIGKREEADVEVLATRAAASRTRVSQVSDTLAEVSATIRRADLPGQAKETASTVQSGTRVITSDVTHTFEHWDGLRLSVGAFEDELRPDFKRVFRSSAAIGRDLSWLVKTASSPDSTFGAMFGDRELLDDVLGMTKDIKRRPWKMLMNWDQ